MKILHTVEFYEPSKGGAQEVVKQLSEHMVLAGHDVTVATTKLPERKSKIINGVKIVEFALSGNEVRGYEGDTKSYQDFLKEGDWDVVMNYAAQQWASDLFFPLMDQVSAKKVFVPCGFSGLYLPEYKSYFAKMPAILRAYDASIYLSSSYRDIDFARKHKVSNLHVIPNGADEREFGHLPQTDLKNLGIDQDSFLVLSVGSHTGLKGHKETMEIFKRSNVDDATLVIIGNKFGRNGCLRGCQRTAQKMNLAFRLQRKKKKVVVMDPDRKTTLGIFRAADLFLFPSNIEASPLVLFEACASKTPFLATDVGNSVEIARWTGGGEILTTTKDDQGYSHAKIAESAKMLEDLYHDTDKRERLAEAGHKSWQNKYSWARISDSYLKLYQEVLKK